MASKTESQDFLRALQEAASAYLLHSQPLPAQSTDTNPPSFRPCPGNEPRAQNFAESSMPPDLDDLFDLDDLDDQWLDSLPPIEKNQTLIELRPVASSSSGEDLDDGKRRNKRLMTESDEEQSFEPQSTCVDEAEKRRKRSRLSPDAPRFLFITRSQEDILDDGYKWRKYGQKGVKNSIYPRNYYRCSNIGCNVQKKVERCSVDPSLVLTLYEGIHRHQCPNA